MKAPISSAFLLLVPALAAGADGDLDPTFGLQGVALATTALGDGPRALAVDSAGRIVAVGDAVSGPEASVFLVARFTPEGELDPAFDGDGLRAVGFAYGGVTNDHATSVAIQPDGKIVVAGYATAAGGASTAGALVRLMPNGALDSTFDGDGIAVLAVAGQNHAFHRVRVKPAGTLVVAGHFDDTVNDSQVELVGYSALGAPTGFFTFDLFPALADRVGAFLLEPDGRPVVAAFASTSSEVVVTRRLIDGTPDSTFGGDGLGHYAQPAAVTGVDLDRVEDGRYVLGVDFAGSAGFDWLLPNGAVDPAACTVLPFCVLFGFDLVGLAARSDGRVIGIGDDEATGDPRVFRLLEAGNLDAAFGAAGSREFDCTPGGGTSTDTGRAVVLDGGRAAALAWRSGDATADAFCLARLESELIFASGVEGGDLWGWSASAL